MAIGAITLRSGQSQASWTAGPPALTPVANRPLLLHAVDTLRSAGADGVVVTGDALVLDLASEWLDADVDTVEVPEYTRPADALLAIADRLRGERIAVHDGEGMLLRGAEGLRAALVDDSADATVFFRDMDDRISGVHVFSDSILGTLTGATTLLEAIDRLAAGGGRVQAGVLAGWWSWDACADRVLEVNRSVLETLEPAVARSSLEGSRLEGRVRVHPTARLRNAVVRGPVVIGAHARVTDAYVGPFTTVGDGATIENSEIEASIVLPRARICHVGVRVEASIVGEDATVGRDFALPKAMRLRVGAGASVQLS